MCCKGCGKALPAESPISVSIDKANGNTYMLRPTHKGCEHGGWNSAGKLSVTSDAAKTLKMKEFILNWYQLKGIAVPKCVAERFEA